MEQFQLASAIFLKEFLKLVDIQNLNLESIDEHIEYLKSQILLDQESDEQIKMEQNCNPQVEYPEFEHHMRQKTKKKHSNKERSNGDKYFNCSKCSKKFNHPSSLSRHKKNQHKIVKKDKFELNQLQSQQQEVVINLMDLDI
ncbi:unnamed protein product (macronuclear) [Paramecium tetraurelia]|uniref:C2H2-type domain-containing protein n=1 Tax=Paramecium tetraurelia TaxID=5888 RepID=A0E056_PARTE|nr:uncharacterized protein GSPATT00021841001 [Paramecium tetraurelia]CAK88673.1 unnamed protein product [Paramecium tetraurelia]|eukprot:XP_001456070.1 hypothetical protein (macronuclear) [Paramecium tetraurelia strain d4-2]